MNQLEKTRALSPEYGRLVTGLLAMAEDAGVGLLVLDGDNSVLVCNDSATAYLRVGTNAVFSDAHRGVSKLAAALYASLSLPRPLEQDAIMLVERREQCFVRCTLRSLPSPDGLPLSLCVFSQSSTVPEAEGVEIVRIPGETEVDGDDCVVGKLTSSELAILRMIGEGLSTPQMARKLSRSPKTVEWHRASLGRKLHAKTRVELARIAITLGIVQNITSEEHQAARRRNASTSVRAEPKPISVDGVASNHHPKGSVHL